MAHFLGSIILTQLLFGALAGLIFMLVLTKVTRGEKKREKPSNDYGGYGRMMGAYHDGMIGLIKLLVILLVASLVGGAMLLLGVLTGYISAAMGFVAGSLIGLFLS